MVALRRTLGDALRKAVGKALDRKLSQRSPRKESTRLAPRPLRPRSRRTPPPLAARYPGDYTGPLEMAYDPHPGNAADPGEVVWTWVPYEEDHHKGKDRPVLVVGRDGDWLLGLPLTSKDHDRDEAQEAGAGRYWIDVGTGGWDREGRPSEARVDRVVRLNPAAVRRIGGKVSPEVFAAVVREVRARRRS